VLDVSVHPNGSLFATGSSDARVKLWDLATRTCTQTLTQHTDQVWAVAFSSEGMLATASDDKQLIIHTEKEQGGS
jgi:WD repeat-containing protein 61